jgi:hypothetical protein
MRRRLWLGISILALTSVAAVVSQGTCYEYPNSRITAFPTSGLFACAATGSGCRECPQYDQDGRYRSCVEDNQGHRFCISNQDTPGGWGP